MMPLRLIERVLPWLVGSLADDEAKNFLKNMHLAGYIFHSLHCFSYVDRLYTSTTPTLLYVACLTYVFSVIQLQHQILL